MSLINVDAGDLAIAIPEKMPVPLLVVDHVAFLISDSLIGHFFDELASRDPKTRTVPPNLYREDLLSMCVVHSTWTPIVQRILRKHVRIHSPERLSLFLAMPDCGQWVAELWYIHDITPGKKKKPTETRSPRSHWYLLADLLLRLPNLRFLSVELVDREGTYLGSKDAEKISDPFDKVAKQEGIRSAGIRDALASIGKLTRLEGLVLLCDAFRKEFRGHDYGKYKSGRYLPYFIQLCQQIPNLTNLRYLHIRGWGGWYDERYDKGSGPKVDKEPLSESLVGKTPPASLKTLILEVPHHRCSFSHFKWLQLPRGNYKLQNLFVRFNGECNCADACNWAMLAWDDDDFYPLTSLESVRIEFADPGHRAKEDPSRDAAYQIRRETARVFMGRLTAVRTLHAPPIFLDALLPSTLRDLRIVFETTRLGNETERERENNWWLRDCALEALIRDMKYQGERPKFVVTVTEEEDEEGFFYERDQDFLDERVENTLGFCEDNGIDFFTAEEKYLEGRIHDFLLFGRVDCLGPENNLLFGEFSYGSARQSDDDVLVLGPGDGSKNTTEREGADADSSSDGDESDATA